MSRLGDWLGARGVTLTGCDVLLHDMAVSCLESEAIAPSPLDGSREVLTGALSSPCSRCHVSQTLWVSVSAPAPWSLAGPASVITAVAQWAACSLPLGRVLGSISSYPWGVNSWYLRWASFLTFVWCLMDLFCFLQNRFLVQDINTFYFQIKYWYTC